MKQPPREVPTLLALAMVLTLGLLARALGLAENPPGFFLDESSLAYNAWLIGQAGIDQYAERWPLYFRALDDYKEPLFMYSVAALVKARGLSVEVARVGAALWGVLGIGVAFCLGREVLGARYGGLLSALFVAVTPWHVQSSRWSEQALVLTVVHSAAVLLLIRTIRRGRRRDAVLGGLLLASGLYAYSTARLLVPATLFAFLAFTAWYRRDRAPAARILVLVFACAALPFGLAQLRLGEALNLRAATLGLAPSEMPLAYLSHLTPAFLFGAGDGNLRHTPGAGLLPWYLGPLWLVGAFQAWRSRSRIGFAVVGLALFAPVLGALTREFPHATRALTMLPYVQITAAAGALFALRAVPERRQASVRGALLVLVGATFAVFWRGYWTDYPKASASAWRFDVVDALRFAHDWAGPDETVFAPTAHYADWLFVARVPPGEIVAHRADLQHEADAYDPFDTRGKYAFLDARARVGRRAIDAAQRLELRPGLWVLPLPVVPPELKPRCLYRSDAYCVVRIVPSGG